MRRPVALLLPALLLVIVACSTTAPSTPPSSAPTTPPAGSPAPSPLPSPDPTPPPASPVVTPAPTAVPSPAETPAPMMTAAEAALMRELRTDTAVNCVPRRTDLPPGAIRGIECRPNDPLVARVGVYQFKTGNEAAYAYMTRMASSGVDVNSGDCNQDVPGESGWIPGDGELEPTDPDAFNWENSALVTERIGCFRDENGTANVRAVCDASYIGVLGTAADLSDLFDWTWRYPQGYEPGTPDAPGLCVGEPVTAMIR